MNLAAGSSWQPPQDWTRIIAIDAHTGGEPLRIFIGGYPEPEGATILDRRRYCAAQLDSLRTATVWEPRGHRDMYGCIITPPERPDSHFGVIFTHNEGYSSMCGHGIIAVTTVALATGMLPRREGENEIRIDSPAGLIVAWAEVAEGRVGEVRFHCVPSFPTLLDGCVSVPGLGDVHFDIAYGGAFYAFVDAERLGLETTAANAATLVEAGSRIKAALVDHPAITHPVDAELAFLYGTIFTGPPQRADSNTRNVCVFADGELDRSPTGTGVSARLAIAAARGELAVGERRVYESIIGSQFSGRISREIDYGGATAVVPEVCGEAHICGRQEFLLDPADPLCHGFLLGK
jgi:trans-L-3-hydroxyproline dehydratase